jgi:hypothetical protein
MHALSRSRLGVEQGGGSSREVALLQSFLRSWAGQQAPDVKELRKVSMMMARSAGEVPFSVLMTPATSGSSNDRSDSSDANSRAEKTEPTADVETAAGRVRRVLKVCLRPGNGLPSRCNAQRVRCSVPGLHGLPVPRPPSPPPSFFPVLTFLRTQLPPPFFPSFLLVPLPPFPTHPPSTRPAVSFAPPSNFLSACRSIDLLPCASRRWRQRPRSGPWYRLTAGARLPRDRRSLGMVPAPLHRWVVPLYTGQRVRVPAQGALAALQGLRCKRSAPCTRPCKTFATS